MTLRVVLMGLLLLLSACSQLGSKSDSDALPPPPGPEQIAEVTSEPLPRDNPRSPPRGALPDDGGAAVGGSYKDPYRIGGSSPGADGDAIAEIGDSGPREAPSKPSKYAYKPPDPSTLPQAPMAGRVGVMNLLGNELRHIHAGTTPLGDHEKSYQVQYDFGGQVMEDLRKALLTKTPYQPVPVNSTALLRKKSATWQDTWNGKSFSPEIQREFDGIIKQNRLAMLIVVSAPTIDDGVVGTSQKLTGSGLYTRTFFGKTQAAVFSTLQFYRVVGEPARLISPVAPAGERSIGDLPNAKLPDELEDLPPRYLAPVYEPLRNIVANKINGLVSLPRKVGH